MSKLFSSKTLLISLVPILSVCALALSSCNRGPDVSPSAVIQGWLKVYPKDLMTAATLTSWGMREGLSPNEWASRQKETMREFQFVEGQIVSEEIEDNKAEVVVDVRISSVFGEQMQREQYRLSISDNNNWVIDERAVVMIFPAPPSFS